MTIISITDHITHNIERRSAERLKVAKQIAFRAALTNILMFGAGFFLAVYWVSK